MSRDRQYVIDTHDPAMLPNEDTVLMSARATARLLVGWEIVPLAQARKHMNPAYDCAIMNLWEV